MPLTIQVDGAALVRVATPANGTLEDLGYTADGCEITEQIYTHDVPTDLFGGEQGPPTDVQYMGEVHVIRLNLTKYDELVVNKIRAGLATGTAGTIGVPGSLYVQGGFSWRLLIGTPFRPRNYVNVIFGKEPKELNKGTKFSRTMVVATAYANSAGTLYNSTIS